MASYNRDVKAAKTTTTLQGIEVVNAIYGRRAIRRYTPDSIDQPSLERLIHAAIQAPSAMNEQPWGFVVIAGAARLKGYSDRIKAHGLQVESRVPELTRAFGDNVFHGAPALIVICSTAPQPQGAEDCCLAAANLMLAAFANGLGSCPIGLARPWLSLTDTKRELGIPSDWVPIVPIVVGIADEEPEAPPRRAARIVWSGSFS
jgi:nitroreductase